MNWLPGLQQAVPSAAAFLISSSASAWHAPFPSRHVFSPWGGVEGMICVCLSLTGRGRGQDHVSRLRCSTQGGS